MLLLIGALSLSVRILGFSLELDPLCFFPGEEKISGTSLPHFLDMAERRWLPTNNNSRETAPHPHRPTTKPPSGCWTWNNPTTYWRPHTHSLGSIYSARAEKFFCNCELLYAPLSVLMEFKLVYILCGNFTCTMQMSIIDIDVSSLFFAVISFYFQPYNYFFTWSGCTIFAIKHWLIYRFTESALVVAFPPPCSLWAFYQMQKHFLNMEGLWNTPVGMLF